MEPMARARAGREEGFGRVGTYERIWETVRQIPKGLVATYGEVAAEAGFPGQARMVGYALHALPPGSGVPWQRVINAMGKISFPSGSEAYTRQKDLLRKEGIVFRGDRIDRRRFGWLRER
jgi:methylated-DNA-protein-cysteine methyltransferase-like protein